MADTLRQNVVTLHDFLYGPSEDYTPSENIWEISSNIIAIVGGEAELREEMPDIQSDEDNDDFVWTYNAVQNGGDPYALGSSLSGNTGSTSGSYETESQSGSTQSTAWPSPSYSDSGTSYINNSDYNNNSDFGSQPIADGGESYEPEDDSGYVDSGNDYDYGYDEPSFEPYEEAGGGYGEEDASFISSFDDEGE